MSRMWKTNLIFVLATVVLVVGGRVDASMPLPAFPTPPAALMEITSHMGEREEAAILAAEPLAASNNALLELDTSSLPVSEVALAAAFPSTASNPLTAALAIEVPNPNTFLKDDVFLQQLSRERARASADEAIEAGVLIETEADSETDAEVERREKSAEKPLAPPPRRRNRQEKDGAKPVDNKSTDPASLGDLFNNRSGKYSSKNRGLFRGHQRTAAAKRLPQHDNAPHQQFIPRTFRSSEGHFERNRNYRDLHSPKDMPFPHHGGHVSAPHNKGRPEAKANQPKPPVSRHILAQRSGSRTNGFPSPRSQRGERAAARRAARQKYLDRLAGKVPLGPRRSQQKTRRARKGKGHNVESKLKKAGKGKAGKGKAKANKGKKSPKGKKNGGKKPAPGKKNAVAGKANKLSSKLQQKSNVGLKKLANVAHKGIAGIANKLRSKVGDSSKTGKVLTRGINKLQNSAHKGVNNAVARARQSLKNRFGGFFTMAELKAELASQRGPGGAALPGAPGKVAPPTSFPGGAFDQVQQKRDELRAEAKRFKDEEFAAVQARADLAKLEAIFQQREAILAKHQDAKFKAHSNLHTMFGASNGVFDRLPTHPTQQGMRGSPAHRSLTPARRIVPARLARLEDLRVAQRRKTYARGTMADRYHAQLHGEGLGVFSGPGEYTESDSFIQMKDGAVHDAPPPMRQPPM